MDKQIRNILLIGFGTIGVAVGTYFIIYSVRKKRYIKRNVPEEGSSFQVEDTAENYNPKSDADYLKSKIHGFGIWADAYYEVADRLQRLSDDKLIKLNNYYNSKGYKEDGRTLVRELEHEDALECPPFIDYCYNNVIKRMKNLGLN